MKFCFPISQSSNRKRRFQAGDVAELDVARVTTEAAATESEALALDRARAELEHALAVLVGVVASNFQVATIEWYWGNASRTSESRPVKPDMSQDLILTVEKDDRSEHHGNGSAR